MTPTTDRETPRNCLVPPPDDTPDREQYDRFRDFLAIMGRARRDPAGLPYVTEATMRYMRGEDVAPTWPQGQNPDG